MEIEHRGRRREGDSMLGSYDQKLIEIEDFINEKVNSLIPPQAQWSIIVYGTTIAYACLSCFIVFAREDFINVFFDYNNSLIAHSGFTFNL